MNSNNSLVNGNFQNPSKAASLPVLWPMVCDGLWYPKHRISRHKSNALHTQAWYKHQYMDLVHLWDLQTYQMQGTPTLSQLMSFWTCWDGKQATTFASICNCSRIISFVTTQIPEHDIFQALCRDWFWQFPPEQQVKLNKYNKILSHWGHITTFKC